MIAKKKPESKIPTTKTNTNRKRSAKSYRGKQYAEESLSDDILAPESFLNKNEYIMIILSALCLTLIIFYFFFKTSDSDSDTVHRGADSAALISLEKRIENIEQILETFVNKNADSSSSNKGVDPLDARLTRLETAFTVKFESLTEKVGAIEKQVASLNKTRTVSRKKSYASKPKSVSKKKTSSVKVSKKKATKTAILHTVKKGETFYSISRKYNISISKLLKLNKMTKKDKIYPGTNLIVR